MTDRLRQQLYGLASRLAGAPVTTRAAALAVLRQHWDQAARLTDDELESIVPDDADIPEPPDGA